MTRPYRLTRKERQMLRDRKIPAVVIDARGRCLSCLNFATAKMLADHANAEGGYTTPWRAVSVYETASLPTATER